MIFQQKLGDTGVSIPEIGLGTWNYHGGLAPLQAGLDAGACFIDTAESYGTEEWVGEVLRGRRGEVFLATKVSREHLRAAEVRRAAESSLRRLGTDHIDLYQVHEPSPTVPIGETMAALEGLVDEGKVRFIGVSNFALDELRQAQAALRRHRIVANQVRYNLIDRTIERDLLAYCQEQKITVIAYSPLGREARKVRDADPAGALGEVARESGHSVPQVLLNWCLCRPGVVVIPKGNSVEHVRDNCGGSGWRLSPEQVRRLDQRVRSRQRRGWEIWLRRLVRGKASQWVKRGVDFLPARLRRRLQ